MNMTTNADSGLEALRELALVRVKKSSYGITANAIRISNDDFRAFAEGRRERLPLDKLQALARELTGGMSTYDVERDKMRSTNTTPPRSLCTALPPPAVGRQGPMPQYRGGELRFVDPNAAPVKPKKRAGWLDSLLGT